MLKKTSPNKGVGPDVVDPRRGNYAQNSCIKFCVIFESVAGSVSGSCCMENDMSCASAKDEAGEGYEWPTPDCAHLMHNESL